MAQILVHDRRPWLTDSPAAVSDLAALVETANVVDTVVGGYAGYVAPTGSDSTGTGTQANPWLTPAYAISQLSGGTSLGLLPGTYASAIGPVKAGMLIAAVNDGQAILSGPFNPGDGGFTMLGLQLTHAAAQKELGANNTYLRMSFVNGPACGNTANVNCGSNTKVYNSAVYGPGGRYPFLAWQKTGVIVANLLVRMDGGWGEGSTDCTEYEPTAGFHMYDTSGFVVLGVYTFDAISTAHASAERLGGTGCSSHTDLGTAGTFTNCLIVNSGVFGRFWGDGLGSHDVSYVDCEVYGNGYEYGMTRNCLGTTTATRFDTDAPTPVAAFKGAITRTRGSQLVLNTAFLDDPRWATELQAVRRGGWGSSGLRLSAYLGSFRA